MINDAAQYIAKGNFFKAMTVKGAKTFIVCLGAFPDGHVYFAHAGRDRVTDRARVTKHTYGHTIKAIESGDIEPVERKDVDPERIGLLALGLTALSKRMSAQEYLDKRESGEIPAEDPHALLGG